MKEIGPITGTDCKITMKEIGPIAGTDCKNTMTEINHAGVIDHQSITKNNYKRENYNIFQDHRSRRNYKYHCMDKYERGFYNTFQDHGNRKIYKDC